MKGGVEWAPMMQLRAAEGGKRGAREEKLRPEREERPRADLQAQGQSASGPRHN